MNNRLYSTVTVKAANSETWEFTGVASTPTPDRANDTVQPGGAQYTLPIPLLWAHDHKAPIGNVTNATVTESGIEVGGYIQQPDETMPPGLSGRLKEAWASVKNQLARGLSIGFRPLDYEPRDDGGMNIKGWELLEVSVVSVPMNQEASIQNIKSFSAPEPEPINHGGYSLRHSFKRLYNTTGT